MSGSERLLPDAGVLNVAGPPGESEAPGIHELVLDLLREVLRDGRLPRGESPMGGGIR